MGPTPSTSVWTLHVKWNTLALMSSKLVVIPVAALVCGIACLPFLGGLPNGHDWIFELVRIVEFNEALRAGQIPPAWAGDLYGGYGSPDFLFYAPLFCLGSSFFYLLSKSYAASMILTLVGFTLLSAFSVYLLAKQVCTNGKGTDFTAARISMYLYVLSPYLFCDKFLRNSNAEFAALCLLPLVPLGILLTKREPLRGFLVTSIALALVTITHNVTALFAAALAAGLALLLYLPRPSKPVVLSVAAGIAWGLVMSVFFWLPALHLFPEVRGNELLSGKFDFHNQFVDLAGVFSYAEFYSTGPLALLVLLGVIVALIIRSYNSPRAKRLLLASLISALFSMFLLTKESVLIWETLPLLPFLQFPWRLLGPFALIIAVSGGLAFSSLMTNRSGLSRGVLEVAVLGACILNAIPGMLLVKSIEVSEWESIEQLIRPESIQKRGLRATVLLEYMPKLGDRNAWRTARPQKGPLISVPPDLDVVVDRNERIDIQLKITTPVETKLQLARWLFPGWKANLDGEPLELIGSELGSIEFTLPAGSHIFRCFYDEPPVRKFTKWLSLMAFLTWLGFVIKWAIRRRDSASG